MSTSEENRKLIIETALKNPLWPQRRVAKVTKTSRKTVGKVLKRYIQDFSLKRREGSGRKIGCQSPKKVSKIVSLFKKNPRLSLRKVAIKARSSKSTVDRVKKKAGLKSYKVQKVPDRNAVKNTEAKTRAKKLYSDYFSNSFCCIMDDETYVLADFNQLPGQEFYVADARGNVEEQYKVKKMTKFPKKFLVWQAICSCGRKSDSFVTSGSVNSEIYMEECLKKRLLPFYRSHSSSVFFWPDLASCHYSKKTIEWYEANSINFVKREANPPNCPELRPIERYWAITKRELRNTQKVSRDMADFKRKWSAASRKVPETTIKNLMEGVPNKVKDFYKN